VTDIESTHPENDVFGNVGGVVGDAFEMASSQDELQVGGHARDVLGHALEQIFKDTVAILIDNIVAFQDLRGQLRVAKDQCTQAAADHGAHGFGHGGQFFGGFRFGHFAQGNHPRRNVHGDIPDAFEVIARDVAHLIKSLIGVTTEVVVKNPDEIPRSQGKAVRVRDLRPKEI